MGRDRQRLQKPRIPFNRFNITASNYPRNNVELRVSGGATCSGDDPVYVRYSSAELVHRVDNLRTPVWKLFLGQSGMPD